MKKLMFWIMVAAMISCGFSIKKASAASFDCSKAETLTEIAICNDSSLSAQDDQLGHVYQQLRTKIQSQGGSTSNLSTNERSALVLRNACRGDKGCLENWYQQRIAVLDQQLNPVAAQQQPSNTSQEQTEDTNPISEGEFISIGEYMNDNAMTQLTLADVQQFKQNIVEFCQNMPIQQPWIGSISNLNPLPDGGAFVGIQLADGVFVFSNVSEVSSLYAKLAKMHEGETVTFTGDVFHPLNTCSSAVEASGAAPTSLQIKLFDIN